MRLTVRGWVVAGGSTILYAVGEAAGYPFFRALAGAGLGAVLAAVVFTARQAAVTVHRDIHPDRVERGRPALARLRVSNARTRRQPGFTAADRVGDTRRLVKVRALPPGGEATYHYELPTERRGPMPVGPLHLERSDPLGLVRSRRTAGESATLWVHPHSYPLQAVLGGHRRHHHEGRTADESLRGSADLRDVREYVVGDEVRHLHWKATARTGQLMVRDYVDPNQLRLSVLLDDRAGALPPELFEEAVDVAASALRAAAMAGQHTRLLTSTGLDVPTSGGPLAARQLLDTLCELSLAPADDAALVPPVLSTSRSGGGSLAVITGAISSADLRAVTALRRQHPAVVLVSLSSDAVAATAAGVRILHARGAEQAVRQWNTVVAK